MLGSFGGQPTGLCSNGVPRDASEHFWQPCGSAIPSLSTSGPAKRCGATPRRLVLATAWTNGSSLFSDRIAALAAPKASLMARPCTERTCAPVKLSSLSSSCTTRSHLAETIHLNQTQSNHNVLCVSSAIRGLLSPCRFQKHTDIMCRGESVSIVACVIAVMAELWPATRHYRDRDTPGRGSTLNVASTPSYEIPLTYADLPRRGSSLSHESLKARPSYATSRRPSDYVAEADRTSGRLGSRDNVDRHAQRAPSDEEYDDFADVQEPDRRRRARTSPVRQYEDEFVPLSRRSTKDSGYQSERSTRNLDEPSSRHRHVTFDQSSDKNRHIRRDDGLRGDYGLKETETARLSSRSHNETFDRSQRLERRGSHFDDPDTPSGRSPPVGLPDRPRHKKTDDGLGGLYGFGTNQPQLQDSPDDVSDYEESTRKTIDADARRESEATQSTRRDQRSDQPHTRSVSGYEPNSSRLRKDRYGKDDPRMLLHRDPGRVTLEAPRRFDQRLDSRRDRLEQKLDDRDHRRHHNIEERRSGTHDQDLKQRERVDYRPRNDDRHR